MLTYSFDKEKGKPLYEQLYRFIRNDILSGVISGNEKLPSKRELADHLKISKVTVENAYSILVSEGYVYSKEKVGYFAETGLTTPVPDKFNRESGNLEKKKNKYCIDLASNTVPPAQFPFTTWAKIMRNICLEKTEELLKQIEFKGTVCLRQSISRYLYEERGMKVSYEDIIIGAGSEYLYGVISIILGEEKYVAVECPTYPKILNAYNSNKIKILNLNMDNEGVALSGLNNKDCNIIHISPSHNFPTGIVTSPKRRQEILTWLSNQKDRYVIEDDFDSELRITGKPIPALYSMDKSNRVIYMNTFSKTIAPSVRISYCVLPHDLALKAEEIFKHSSCTVSSFEQYTLSSFIDNGYFERHINRNRKYYKKLREDLYKVLSEKNTDKLKFIDSQAGLHFMIEIKTDKNDDELKQMFESNNIKASFYSDYCKDNMIAHRLLVNYSGLNVEQFSSALDILLRNI
jgi:GntR family transcriptional regulator / MocR family aminotransferase